MPRRDEPERADVAAARVLREEAIAPRYQEDLYDDRPPAARRYGLRMREPISGMDYDEPMPSRRREIMYAERPPMPSRRREPAYEEMPPMPSRRREPAYEEMPPMPPMPGRRREPVMREPAYGNPALDDPEGEAPPRRHRRRR